MLTAGTAGPEINDFYFLLHQVAVEDVLGFEVAVDDLDVLEVDEALDDLEGDGLDLGSDVEALELVVFQVEVQVLP